MKRLGALTCVAATLLAVLAIPGQTSAQPNQFTIFDPPGSTNTLPRSINPMGVITGQYTDASNVVHGFLRAPDGNITTIDPPGSIYTDPTSINRRVRSRDISQTPAMWGMASCVISMAHSPSLILPVRLISSMA